jgi:hypothetical protein
VVCVVWYCVCGVCVVCVCVGGGVWVCVCVWVGMVCVVWYVCVWHLVVFAQYEGNTYCDSSLYSSCLLINSLVLFTVNKVMQSRKVITVVFSVC